MLFLLAVLFWLPAAVRLENWGDDMWHRAFMLAGAARRSLLHYGQFPFWNPYMSGGAPLLANPASSFLSPSFILVLVAGEVVGLKLRVLLALWIGLCGGYLLGRRLAPARLVRESVAGRPGRLAPYFCAFIFMLGSWYPLYMFHWHDEFMPFVYLPWLLLFLSMGTERARWCALGGLTLGLMVLEGGVYPAPYAALCISIFALLESIRLRSPRPIMSLALIGALGCLVSGMKLLPSLDLHLRYPRPTFWREPVLPWAALPRMLWGRDQLADSGFRGAWLGWWEYGMYIGVIPLALALSAALLLLRRSWPVVVTGLIAGSLMFGDYGVFSAWHWVHMLPVFSSLHDPIRFRILLVLFLAILSAMAVSRIENWKSSESPLVAAVLILAAAWMGMDYWSVSAGLYAGISSRPPLVPERRGEFRQARLSKADQQGPQAYLLFLQNEGLVNNYEPLEFPDVGVRAFDEPGYKGEAWLEGAEGAVEPCAWSPNRLCYRVRAGGNALLVVNQRYEPGWRTQDGAPAVSMGGLLAAAVAPPGREICLRYIPPFFYAGCAFSALGIALALALWMKG